MFFLLFGLNKAYDGRRYGQGNVAAEVMISLALYGAVLATTFNWTWVVNVLAWLVIFAGGAAWRMRKDTARV